MADTEIIINLGEGGLGRALDGEDYVSGMVFFSADLPGGFTTDSRIKEFYSTVDAEAAGILADSSDETPATAEYQVTAIGTNGNTVSLSVVEPTQVVQLGVYTKTAAETTINAVATAIADKVNAGTEDHGYTAVAATDTITVTARPGLGVSLNTGNRFVVDAVGTIDGDVTQFTGGVGSLFALFHYEIDEFFRIQPKGRLFVGIFPIPTTYEFTEMRTVQLFADGKVRQFGVLKTGAAFSAADVDKIQAVAAELQASHMETVALFGPDISTMTLSTLPDLSVKTCPNVGVVIGQDGGAVGAALARATGKSVPCVGAALGALALSAVHESIAWKGKFDMSDGTELDTPAFANGVLLKSDTVNDALLKEINRRGYIYLKKSVGSAGTFFNDNRTATAKSSDYAYLNDVRTVQKASRGLYAALLPLSNSPLARNEDGTLADETIYTFETAAEKPLDDMRKAGEISAREVVMNPAQNVVSTNKVVLYATIVVNGVARQIVVNLGLS